MLSILVQPLNNSLFSESLSSSWLLSSADTEQLFLFFGNLPFDSVLSLPQVLFLLWVISTSSHIIQLHNSIIISEPLSFSHLQPTLCFSHRLPMHILVTTGNSSLFGSFQTTLPQSLFLFLSVSHALVDNIFLPLRRAKALEASISF